MKNNIDNFSVSFTCSIILHLLAIYFFLFGFPHLFKKLPEEQVIVFEMLPVSDKSNVPTKVKQNKKSIENENAKKIVQSKPKPVEEKKPKPVEEKKPEPVEEKKTEPVEEKKPEPVEEKKPEPVEEKKPKPVEEKKPEPVEEKKPEPVEEKKPKPVEEKKPEPVEEKKQIEKKKIIEKTDLDSLLKNLEQSSEGTNLKSNKQARSKENTETKDSKGPYNETLPLLASEKSAIQQQIEKHWNVTAVGARNVAQARINVYILLNQDGTIQEVKLQETRCPNMSDNTCSALADSAIRAVWKASPINNLNPKRYSVWREIIFTFDPSKVL